MAACEPNIGKRQRRRRLIAGVLGVVAAIALGIALGVADAPAVLRASVFVPLYLGALGFSQYRERTCVYFAIRGVRDIGEGVEVVTSDAELQSARRQARRIHLESVATASLLTVLYLLIT